MYGLAGFLGFGHSAKHAHFFFKNSLFCQLFGRSWGGLLCEVRGTCFYVVFRIRDIFSYIFSVRLHFSITGRGKSDDTKYI